MEGWDCKIGSVTIRVGNTLFLMEKIANLAE